MNTIKKVILTGVLTVATASIMATCSQATTVKVTGDTINVRKDASTSSEVIAMLSKDVECELLEEVDGWYKIKYKSYTGYISKDYSKKVEDSSQNQSSGNNNESSDNKNDENTNKETNNQGTDTQTTNSETTNNQTTNNQNNESTNNANIQDENNDSKADSSNSNVEEPREVKVVYKKFLQNTDVKILPLIYSSKIGSVKKGVEVIIITETTGGWSYIQTDTFNGWVRTTSLGEARTVTTSTGGATTTEGNGTSGEKVGYVNEQGVNLRKGAGTNYNVVKVLYLNTKVTILKEEGSWYQVKAGNDTGYISKEFVSDTKITSTRGNSNPRTLDDDEKAKDETKAKDEEKSDNNIIVGATETNIAQNTTQTTATSTSKTNSTNASSKEATSSANTSSKATTSSNNTSSKSTTNTTDTSSKSTTNSTTTSNKEEKTEASEVISYAKKYLGCKYVYGGDGSNKTFDCSGFTMYVFKNFGISLPHGATSQYNSGKGTKISKQSDLKMGDIVFLTDYETGVGIGHCGIYIGDGEFIHASTTTYTVTISSLNTMYKGRFYAGLRLI